MKMKEKMIKLIIMIQKKTIMIEKMKKMLI